jgi:hypothetical protein
MDKPYILVRLESNIKFVVETISFATPWSNILYFGLDYELILISETPTFNNEIVSSHMGLSSFCSLFLVN